MQNFRTNSRRILISLSTILKSKSRLQLRLSLRTKIMTLTMIVIRMKTILRMTLVLEAFSTLLLMRDRLNVDVVVAAVCAIMSIR